MSFGSFVVGDETDAKPCWPRLGCGERGNILEIKFHIGETLYQKYFAYVIKIKQTAWMIIWRTMAIS